MDVPKSKIVVAIQQFKTHGGVMRTSETQEAGIHNRTLYYMLAEGHITKLERSLYKLVGSGRLSNLNWVIVAKKVPGAIVCYIFYLF